MSYKATGRSEYAPEFWHEGQEHSRKLAQAVNGILNGQMNNAFTVTLDAGETSTTVPFAPAKAGGSALLFPRNNTASELARNTNVFATAELGEVTVSHGTAAGGESFSLLIVG